MKVRRFVPLTGLVLVASLALAGCAPGEAAPEETSPNPAITNPVYEIPTPGDIVDAAEAANLNTGTVPGVRAYGMQDGTFLVVSDTDPLPEVVIADMQSRVAVVPVATDQASSASNEEQLGQFVFDAREQTGKKVVVLTFSWYPIGVDANSFVQERWVHIGDVDGVVDPMADSTIRNREEYRAILEAAQANDPSIVIIEHG